MNASENLRRLSRRRTLLSIAAAALSVPALPSRLSAQNRLERLVVAGVATEDATNMYYAVKTGMFERVGLDVEMVNMSSGTAATAAMIAGTYDLSRPSIFSVILGHSRGLDVGIVSAANAHDSRRPLALLQVAADSPLRNAADLDGKIIGTPALNDINSVAIRAWSEKNGGDWHSLKFIEIPNGLLESAIVQHRIDAAVLQSPFLFNSLNAKTTRTLGDAWGAIASRFIIGVNAARATWIAQHSDLVRRFVRVYYDAARYVNTHPTETAPYVVELTKIDLAVVLHMSRAIVPTELKVDEIQPVIDAAAKYGAIPEAFPAKAIV